jgi:magnesium transporter
MITHLCVRMPGDPELHVESGSDLQPAALDLQRAELVWLDVEQPTPDDVRWLAETFRFHHLALEDVLGRHQRAKIDEYAGYYFVVLYATRVDVRHRRLDVSELQFFWGPNYLVTVHGEPFPELADLARRLHDGTVTSIATDGAPPVVPDLAYRLLDAIVDGYFPAVDAVAEWSEAIEERMFEGGRQAEETLQAIFDLRKDLLHLRKVLAPNREAVNALLRRDNSLFSSAFVPYFQDIYDHIVRVIDTLDTYRDLLASALETHLSIISNELGQTVKRMTAITAVLMVTALIAGIYGMNFEYMPELHWTYGYPFAIALMLGAGTLLLVVFHRIKWL